MKKWKVKQQPDKMSEALSKYHPLVAQLLYNRKLESQSEIDYFFMPEYANLHDPFLFSDMEKAVNRIIKAIKKNEKILVHGDYDADGVTSAAILQRSFKLLGADIEVFIPHREEDGYGINPNNVSKFIAQGIDLFITVDCGITSVDEVAELQASGMDVIVTDHHEPLENVPNAFAVIDPKVEGCGYPFAGLAGAGVAFKLAQALLSRAEGKLIKSEDLAEWGGLLGFEKWLLDIVAIGTVADVSPLIDENRVLVKWGLIVLGQTRHVGLQKLLEKVNNTRIDSFTIGFQLGPRLNAAGRMNHARVAYDLLVEDDPVRGEEIATELEQTNVARQKVTEQAMKVARDEMAKQDDPSLIFLYNKEWQPGIVGLIAGRLCDEFYRPTLVMTESGGRVVGSGRSIEQLNIVQAISQHSKHLARYGGHAAACGYTLVGEENVKLFQKDLQVAIEKALAGQDLYAALETEAKIKLTDIKMPLAQEIEKFSPFGEANPRPLFVVENLQIAAIDLLGKTQAHMRFMMKQDSPQLYKMLWFGQAKNWKDKLKVGDVVDAVVEVSINEWNGSSSVEFKIADLKVKDI